VELALALEVLAIGHERALEVGRGPHRGQRDRRIGRCVDGDAGEHVPPGEPDHGLPPPVDGKRLGGAVGARPDPAELIEDHRPRVALSGGQRQPVRTVAQRRRPQPHGRHRRALGRLAHLGQRDIGPGPGRHGGRQQVGDHRGDGQQARANVRPRAPGCNQLRAEAQRPAEECADHAAGDPDSDREHERLAEQVCRPRNRHPHVRPAPLGERPDRPDQHPGEDPEPVGPLAADDQRGELDDDARGEIEGEVRDRLSEPGRQQQHRQPEADEDGHGAERRAAPAEHAGEDQRDRREQGDQHRVEEEPELRDPVVELSLEDRERRQQAPAGGDEAQHAQRSTGPLGDEAERRLGAGGPGPPRAAGEAGLGEDHEDAQHRHRSAAEQHQMRRAPEGDVLAEHAVPEIVGRKAEQPEGGAQDQQQAADRRVPVAADPHRRRAGAALGEDDRQPARGEQRHQAAEDQVVRRIGERPRVAAVVDVQGDVPIHPEAGERRPGAGERRRQRGPAGQVSDPPGEAREPPQRLDPSAAVAVAQHQQRARQQDGGSGASDHLRGRSSGRGRVLGRRGGSRGGAREPDRNGPEQGRRAPESRCRQAPHAYGQDRNRNFRYSSRRQIWKPQRLAARS
jgi:hypothetical protein